MALGCVLFASATKINHVLRNKATHDNASATVAHIGHMTDWGEEQRPQTHLPSERGPGGTESRFRQPAERCGRPDMPEWLCCC